MTYYIVYNERTVYNRNIQCITLWLKLSAYTTHKTFWIFEFCVIFMENVKSSFQFIVIRPLWRRRFGLLMSKCKQCLWLDNRTLGGQSCNVGQTQSFHTKQINSSSTGKVFVHRSVFRNISCISQTFWELWIGVTLCICWEKMCLFDAVHAYHQVFIYSLWNHVWHCPHVCTGK